MLMPSSAMTFRLRASAPWSWVVASTSDTFAAIRGSQSTGSAETIDEPGVVDRLVGDAATQHVQTEVRGRFLAGDGRLRRIVELADAAGRERGVGGGRRLTGGQAAEKLAALRQRLRMRVDLAERLERDVGHADEAVPDVDDLLADDRQVEAQQQVVGLVHRSRGRVLDRQHAAVGMTIDDRLEHLPERRIRLQRHRPARHAEVLTRSLVAVRALGALIRDAKFAIGGRRRLQRIVLAAHRVVEDLAEDPAHERGVEADALAERRAVLQQRRLRDRGRARARRRRP